MSNQEILTKAIEKAIAGGWEPSITKVNGQVTTAQTLASVYHPEQLIFNHQFAKALWGEELMLNLLPPGYEPNTYEFEGTYRWRYHLQQMVTAKDPIKYLGENI